MIAQEEPNLLPCKRLVLVHDDDQALTINTISLPGGPRPRVDFFTTERSPNRDLGISKTRFHINILSRWAKSLTKMLKNELSLCHKIGKTTREFDAVNQLDPSPVCIPTPCLSHYFMGFFHIFDTKRIKPLINFQNHHHDCTRPLQQ